MDDDVGTDEGHPAVFRELIPARDAVSCCGLPPGRTFVGIAMDGVFAGKRFDL